MNSADDERRNSRALITDPVKKAEAEAANGLLQYDQGIDAGWIAAHMWTDTDGLFSAHELLVGG